MKVCLDIRSTLKSTTTGIGKYTITLINALNLNCNKKELKLILHYKKKLFDFKKKVPSFKEGDIQYFNGIKRGWPKADIFISSSYDFTPPYGSFILVVQDLIPLSASLYSSTDAKKNLLKNLPLRLKAADSVVCVSYNTKNDLLEFFPEAEEKVKVIHSAVDAMFRKIDDKKLLNEKLKRLNLPEDYLLFVSSIERRKNLLSLLKAFPEIKKEFPGLKIAVAGKNVKSYQEVEEFLQSFKFKDDVIKLGYIKHEDLLYLYNGAKVFVYPSFYEGFGLPILEAFSCGTPVVTSNISSTKEIGKGVAELVNPHNEDNIAKAIIKILSSRKYKDELSKKGLEKAKEFSLEKMGNGFKEIFKEVLEKQRKIE